MAYFKHAVGVMMSLLAAGAIYGQGDFSPYGIDFELVGCDPSPGGDCRVMDYAQVANTQWARIFVPWEQIEE